MEGQATPAKARKGSSDLLREFYFSAGQNYTAFKKKKEKGAASPMSEAAVNEAAAAAAEVEAADTKGQGEQGAPAPQGAKPAAAPAPDPVTVTPVPSKSKQQQTPAGSAVSAAKRTNGASAAANTTSSVIAHASAPTADAASQEYIQFLKQQQDLQKCHNKLEEVVASLESHRRTNQSNLRALRRQASELLVQMEDGSGWNLQSKYTIENIVKDAGLQLQAEQLYSPDAQPQFFELVQQSANLQKLKQDHQEQEQYEPHKVRVNNGLRRLDRAQAELKNTQVDATQLARVPDTLLIQLEHVFTTPTMKSLLAANEENKEHLLFVLEKAKESREAALEDGEMQLAEKFYYTIVEYYEELQSSVLDKLSIVDKTQKETSVFDKVRENYQAKAADEIKRIKSEKEKLKQKCESDTQKLFSLRERIEDVEKQMVLKMAEDCRQSDATIKRNSERLEACWAKIEDCEQELVALERERHREVKKRVEDKEKDEQRRMEFERFCQVCDDHMSHLDLTIRNCESLIHAANLVGEFVANGFDGLQKDFQKKSKDYSELQLDLHREHLTMFRGLFLALGELTHKKEKKIEEVDKQIQTSHINQELCADTLNPNAKKFSDVKKELLRIRDDLEQEVRELKDKAACALERFKSSEDALRDADVDFIHPVVEHQEQALATRAKMVEFKAIAIGHVDSVPIRNEIEDLKRQLAVTKQQVDTVNNRATATTPGLPELAAATR